MQSEFRKRSLLDRSERRQKQPPAYLPPFMPPCLVALGARAFELIYDPEDDMNSQGRWTPLALKTMDYHFKRAVFTARLAEVRNLGENHV